MAKKAYHTRANSNTHSTPVTPRGDSTVGVDTTIAGAAERLKAAEHHRPCYDGHHDGEAHRDGYHTHRQNGIHDEETGDVEQGGAADDGDEDTTP